MKRVRLSINGMSCGHCVSTVKRALSAVPDIKVEDVAVGSATVSYVTDEQLTEAKRRIEEAGYAVASPEAES